MSGGQNGGSSTDNTQNATIQAEDEAASNLLASKSNYTRLLEGDKVLSYSSDLTSHLTSKRTSHKLAEQGRRERINTAIKQLATLLPIDGVGSGGGEEDDDDAGGDEDGKKDRKNAPNSKARTVELAYEYIKQLQGQVQAATGRADVAERRLAGL